MRKPNLIPDFDKGQELKNQFTLIEFHHVLRHENVRAGTLAGLAASMALPENDKLEVTITERELLPPLDTHQAILNCFQVLKSQTPSYEYSFRDWRELFID